MNGIIPTIQLETNLTSMLNASELEKIATQDYRQMSAYLIGQISERDLLDTEEQNIFHIEIQREITVQPLIAKKLVIVLKATRLCNLRCTYCHSWAEGPNQTMSFEIMAIIIHKILSIPNIKRFEFVWHGGEVTLLKPLFFQKLIWLQQKFKKPEHHITNSMQSNVVNISDDWLSFIKGIGMHVGISLDGVPAIHDSRRVDYRGRGTSQRVALGIEKLKRHNIPFGALIVVDKQVYKTDHRKMLDYFIKIGLNNIEFLNIVPDNRIPSGDKIDSSYITYADFISFLTQIFIIWWNEYRTKIVIPQFSDFIHAIKFPGTQLAACYWSENCSQEVITIEPNGNVSPCDKYVGDANSQYGSLLKNDLANLLANSRHNQTARREEQDVFNKMRQCRWFYLCQGGCPHDRVINRRHVVGYQDDCCGTGKLLAVIAEFLDKEQNTVLS
ncbi:darobactin maturation radical SAM/SPASM protein DarE [uncultured Cedecea sp.]|uniref:darobactin maturation radical SAM/SPASM protein DarE n=1 Tax=uncultured Cedecea sp. TaxID=988762 RepID=UPI0026353C5C|nr:darobactin maturation radical SAM/SPASM protein DarE [uncultured Cedecea sp.]